MSEFSEEELNLLVQQALSEDTSHPFAKNNSYLGFAETNLLESLHNRLSKRFIESEINDIFKDIRSEILSRKVSLNLKDLHTITKNCKLCDVSTSAELPKWNVENPDIAIVVDSPSLPAEAISIMVDAFKAVGLSSSQLCLTYVNRCPVKRKYGEQEVINCSPYLHHELAILNPKLIFCLGALPASVLFGFPVKIKDFRGTVRWLGYWPVLTTYSPMYILKSTTFQDNESSFLNNFNNDVLHAYNFLHNKKRFGDD